MAPTARAHSRHFIVQPVCGISVSALIFLALLAWAPSVSAQIGPIGNIGIPPINLYPDDHADTCGSQATQIETTSSTDGAINRRGDRDVFAIHVESRGTVRLSTTGATDTHGFLIDSSGNSFGENAGSGPGSNFEITATLPPGGYCLFVEHEGTGTGQYVLDAQELLPQVNAAVTNLIAELTGIDEDTMRVNIDASWELVGNNPGAFELEVRGDSSQCFSRSTIRNSERQTSLYTQLYTCLWQYVTVTPVLNHTKMNGDRLTIRGTGAKSEYIWAYHAGGYDKDGYDIDGFDRSGYDRDGFDTLGFDREGNPRVYLEVMTYNIRRDDSVDYQPHEDAWRNRRDNLIEKVGEIDADIIGFQEVTDSQLKDLKESLTEYSVKKGKYTTPFWNANERSPIFYKTDMFELIGEGSINVGNSVSDEDRVCTYVELRVLGTGVRFFVLNTHFLSGDKEQKHRNRSVKDIRNLIGKLGLGSKDRIILMGDFNAKSNSEAYGLITEFQSEHAYGQALVDSYLSVQPGGTIDRADTSHPGKDWSFVHEDNNAWYKEAYPEYNLTGVGGVTRPWEEGDNRIDYVFHSRNIVTLESRIDTMHRWMNPEKLEFDKEGNWIETRWIYDAYAPWINGYQDESQRLREIQVGEGINRCSDHDPVVSYLQIN